MPKDDAGQEYPNEAVAPGTHLISVVIKFQLGSSQYATMALREFSCGGVEAYTPDFGGGR